MQVTYTMLKRNRGRIKSIKTCKISIMSATTDKEPQCTMELIYKDTLKMFIKSVKIVVNFKDFQAIVNFAIIFTCFI